MKKIILSLLLLGTIKVSAQQHHVCGTDEVMKKIYAERSELEKTLMTQRQSLQNRQNHLSSSASYTIPVVFHIMHLGGPENISDSQVMDAVRILNNDFSHQSPDTVDIIPSFKSIADSTGIQFALATLDPFGNCTNGIVHHYDTDADWNDSSPSIYSYTWDPTMYMNVYVVKTITLSSGFGAAGYAYYPGSLPAGDPRDGIVVLNNYLGSIGTASPLQSRVLTHEAGHWFGLMHVFGGHGAGVDCTGDDYINDTPTTIGYTVCPNSSVPSSYQICTPGVDENFQNFMDYSYCCRMFTQGQGQNMRITLTDPFSNRDFLSTSNNLALTGVTGQQLTCVPIADFSFNRPITCTGVPITFTDASWNGLPTSYSWSFPSGSPSTSVQAAPMVTYSTPGVYSATLTVSNAAGTSAPVTKSNIITVTTNAATYPSVWSDSFEGSSLPNNDWSIANSSGGANWEQSIDAAYTGAFSAKLPAVGNTRRAVTSITSPTINLSAIPNPILSFKVATAETNPNHINTLEVLTSTDCEQSWQQLYSKTGSALVTTIDSITPFIPVSQSQWRLETIVLSAAASATAASFKFVYTRDTLGGASNIFIDDVNVISTTSIKPIAGKTQIQLYPNPSQGKVKLALTVSHSENVGIEITDVTGRIVKQMQRTVDLGTSTFIIAEDKTLQEGIYLVHVKTSEQELTKKLVIQ